MASSSEFAGDSNAPSSDKKMKHVDDWSTRPMNIDHRDKLMAMKDGWMVRSDI